MKDEQIEALHPATADLVDRFASALKEKLHASQIKYGWQDDWAEDNWEKQCQEALLKHLAKGDPRDVAAFAAFMWHHGWSTSAIDPVEQEALGEVLSKVRMMKDANVIIGDVSKGYAHACGDIERVILLAMKEKYD